MCIIIIRYIWVFDFKLLHCHYNDDGVHSNNNIIIHDNKIIMLLTELMSVIIILCYM